MSCYKSNSCDIYEGLSCSEYPTSRPKYSKQQQNDMLIANPCSDCTIGWEVATENGCKSCRDTCEKYQQWYKAYQYNKPLNSWTVSELKDFCTSQQKCKDCIMLKNSVCRFAGGPFHWDLSRLEKYLGREEIEMLKAIKLLFPTAEFIERIKESGVVGVGNNQDGWIADINNSLFPTLNPGESINIKNALLKYG